MDAEALQVARYMMYSQVYFRQFGGFMTGSSRSCLSAWLPGGLFQTDSASHLRITDNDVNAAILDVVEQSRSSGSVFCRRFSRLFVRHQSNGLSRATSSRYPAKH